MDYFLRSIIYSFLFLPSSVFAVNAWVPTWVNGPPSATYERTPTALKVFVDIPKYGGHYENTLYSNPANSFSSLKSGGGGNFGAASTASTPKISTVLKIPFGNAAGAAGIATLTAVTPKQALAKAAIGLVRINPYVATALTLGWLANAGIDYFSSTDTFQQLPPPMVGTTTIYQVPDGSFTDPILACRSFATTVGWNPDSYIWTIGGVSTCLRNGEAVYTMSTGLQCQSGYTMNVSGECIRNAGAVPAPITQQAAETSLANTPVSGNADSAAGFDAELQELGQNGILPDTDGATPQLTGSTTPVQGPASTTVSPDGTVTTTNTTYSPVYNNNSVTVGETTVTNVTTAGGTTTTTTTGSPIQTVPMSSSAETTEPAKTDCEKFPDNIGCSKYGIIPAAEIIPTTEMPVTMPYTSWGSGSCPSSVSTVHGIVFDYTPMCNALTILKPVLITFALLGSLFIVAGAVKD